MLKYLLSYMFFDDLINFFPLPVINFSLCIYFFYNSILSFDPARGTDTYLIEIPS